MIRFCNLLTLLFLCTHALLVSALPSDSEQSISFQSDRFEMDDIRKTQTYSGRVVVEQGSLIINAEKVVIHGEGRRVSRIVATGQPARYSQIGELGEEPIVAKARRMEYDIIGKTLHLIDEASIVQKGISLSTGNRIDYDVKNAQVKAEGRLTGDSDGRVRTVISPEKKDE